MIILECVGVFIAFVVMSAFSMHQLILPNASRIRRFSSACIDALKGWVAPIVGVCTIIGMGGFLVLVIIAAFTDDKPRQDNPTVLHCNNVIIAESKDGFSYNSTSGTYRDYRSSLTYTPKQGEVCKEYLKGDK